MKLAMLFKRNTGLPKLGACSCHEFMISCIVVIRDFFLFFLLVYCLPVYISLAESCTIQKDLVTLLMM